MRTPTPERGEAVSLVGCPLQSSRRIAHNFADSGQVAAEVGEARSLAGSLEDQLAAVQEALDRIDHGTYGSCQSCGEPIGDARLEAMPETRWCIRCAARPA